MSAVKSTHLIEEYKVAPNTILCCCGWFGSADKFKRHQIISKPTDKVPSELPYPMDSFGKYPPNIINKAFDKEKFDYFDYVHPTKPSKITGRINRNG